MSDQEDSANSVAEDSAGSEEGNSKEESSEAAESEENGSESGSEEAGSKTVTEEEASEAAEDGSSEPKESSEAESGESAEEKNSQENSISEAPQSAALGDLDQAELHMKTTLLAQLLHSKASPNDYLFKKHLLLKQIQEEKQQLKQEFTELHSANLAQARELQELSAQRRAAADTQDQQRELAFYEAENEKIAASIAQLQHQVLHPPSFPPDSDSKASNLAYVKTQKALTDCEAENSALHKALQSAELKLKKLRKDHENGLNRTKSTEVHHKRGVLQDTLAHGDLLETHIGQKTQELSVKIDHQQHECQFEVDNLKEMIKATRVEWKRLHNEKADLDRDIKIKQQDLKNARVSALKVDSSKAKGRLASELELYAKVLSDKFSHLTQLERDIYLAEDEIRHVTKKIETLE